MTNTWRESLAQHGTRMDDGNECELLYLVAMARELENKGMINMTNTDPNLCPECGAYLDEHHAHQSPEEATHSEEKVSAKSKPAPRKRNVEDDK